MAVYQRGPHWHYGFQIGGERFRGPCGVDCTSKTRAKAIEDNKRAEAKAGKLGTHRAPLLCDFAPHFVKFVEDACAAGNLGEALICKHLPILPRVFAWVVARLYCDLISTLQAMPSHA